MRWLLLILCSLIAAEISAAVGDPLFIVNGKEVSKSEFDALSPVFIKKIDVITDDSSIQKYGAKGSNGVFIVTLSCDTPPVFADNKSFQEYLSENITWKENDPLAEVRLKFRVKTDGSTELIDVMHSTDARFKRRVLKTFEESPKWKSPAMNMGEAVEIDNCTVWIKLPKSKIRKTTIR